MAHTYSTLYPNGTQFAIIFLYFQFRFSYFFTFSLDTYIILYKVCRKLGLILCDLWQEYSLRYKLQ
jgi:hypothetical protein